MIDTIPSMLPAMKNVTEAAVRGYGEMSAMAMIVHNCIVTNSVEDISKYMKKIILSLVLFSAAMAQPQQPNAAELQIAVDKLSVLGSVLYVAAHPDDENTALLSYFAKGKLLRTAYLSITRGEGGQNLVGSELGTELGIIRTQELLAARRVDGAEQYFTRAIDFGYSKSAEEAFRLWNKDSVLKDVVWVIRKFRPDVIITRFSPTQGGHGHHLASAILAQEAFALSGDPSVFPEQLKFVRPWKAKRILFNHFRFGGTTSLTNAQPVPTLKIDVGEYNPLLGKSYTELAGISRTMHKSQGMGSTQNRGTSINEFVVTGGDAATYDIFDDIDLTWNRVPGGKKIVRLSAEIKKRFNPSSPENSLHSLLQLYAELRKINTDPLVNGKMQELEWVIRSCLGLTIIARADEPLYTRNDSVTIRMTFLNRSRSRVSVSSVSSQSLGLNSGPAGALSYNVPLQVNLPAVIRSNERLSQPYWLLSPVKGQRYDVTNSEVIGIAENPPVLTVAVSLVIEDESFFFTVPVQYMRIDDLYGEQWRNSEIVPPVSLAMTEQNIVWSDASTKKITLRIRALKNGVNGKALIRSSSGWILAPAKEFTLLKRGDETDIAFNVYRDTSAGSGTITAEAVVDGQVFTSTVKQIEHSHIPPQVVLEPAMTHSLVMDLKKRGTTIGYIMGAGDEVPKALEQMGYSVSMISDAELQEGSFAKYDAVVAGVRAYNTREQLRSMHGSLMKYVENGGTYLVQYQVLERGQTENIGPYPIELSRNRVTDEFAAVSFSKPDHRLLTTPNRITNKDFAGWVQERGLYFPSQWDAKYETILSCADPNEPAQQSSVLYSRYGKGHYIFTGLSFFRQLPAGVDGAYRLFSNLISIGKE
jgi:LmbE family N-acetylglucosaminyl deacetylase